MKKKKTVKNTHTTIAVSKEMRDQLNDLAEKDGGKTVEAYIKELIAWRIK